MRTRSSEAVYVSSSPVPRDSIERNDSRSSTRRQQTRCLPASSIHTSAFSRLAAQAHQRTHVALRRLSSQPCASSRRDLRSSTPSSRDRRSSALKTSETRAYRSTRCPAASGHVARRRAARCRWSCCPTTAHDVQAAEEVAILAAPGPPLQAGQEINQMLVDIPSARSAAPGGANHCSYLAHFHVRVLTRNHRHSPHPLGR